MLIQVLAKGGDIGVGDGNSVLESISNKLVTYEASNNPAWKKVARD